MSDSPQDHPLTDRCTDGSEAPRLREGVSNRWSLYLAFLLLYLSLVAFFDYYATAFRYTMTTYVREDFKVEFGSLVSMLTWVYVGSCLAFIPRVLADVLGRKVMLWATMASLCLFQWLLGFARTPTEYVALLTLLAVFYKSDIWLLVIAEEAPPSRRGFYAAVPIALGITGVIVMGELVRHMGEAGDAWRQIARFPIWGLFLSFPLLLLMRETPHFRRLKAREKRLTGLGLLAAPFRGRLLKRLIVISMLRVVFVGIATAAILIMGSEYLRVDHEFGPDRIGRVLQFEVMASVLAAIVAGFVADRIGRRGCLLLFGILFSASLFHLGSPLRGVVVVMVAYVSQSFAATAINTTLRITTMELFPNDCRATASAWADLFMTLAAAGTAQLIGRLTTDHYWCGTNVTLSAIILIVAAGVLLSLPLLILLRETRGQRLEEA